MAKCTVPIDGKKCGAIISVHSSTSGMWSHLQYHHSAVWASLKQTSAVQRLQPEESTEPGVFYFVTDEKRKRLHRKIAIWIAKKKRPPNLVEDPEFIAIFEDALGGTYQPQTRKM